MRIRVCFVALFVLFGLSLFAQTHSADFVKKDVKEVMRKVADWQVENQSKVRHQPRG